MKQKLDIKPLSVNKCWQGRRYKTDDYKSYEIEVLHKLRKGGIPDGPLKVTLESGFSNMNADVDNVVKPFLDLLQKKYKFNDSRVHMIVSIKKKVPKGFEYVQFEIEQYV